METFQYGTFGEHSADCCTGLRRQSHISQWHRGETEFCCFLVEKKRAFMGTLMCFPPSPTIRRKPLCRRWRKTRQSVFLHQRTLQAHAKPTKPVSSPASSCSCLFPSTGWQTQWAVGTGSRDMVLPPQNSSCFQEFAFLGHLLVLPSPNRVWSPCI